ncbi:putative ATP synthase, F1 complex, gamma subunit [Helianthus anomalus]
MIHTLLPLSPKREICDINGVCVDAAEEELFRLTTKEGKLIVEQDVFRADTMDFSPILQFEQVPVQILDAMGNATDNASELKKILSPIYNR